MYGTATDLNIFDNGFFLVYQVISSFIEVVFSLGSILLSYSFEDVLIHFLKSCFDDAVVDFVLPYFDGIFAFICLDQPIAYWLFVAGFYIVILGSIFKWFIDLYKSIKSLIPFIG